MNEPAVIGTPARVEHPFDAATQAALYVAEVLDEPELGQFLQHLRGGCAECSEQVSYWESARPAFEVIRLFIARRLKRRLFWRIIAISGGAFAIGMVCGGLLVLVLGLEPFRR